MLRLYDEFLEDEDILALKDRAYRLHVSALIYCSRNLTDGFVSDRAVKVLQLILGFQVRRWVAELVEDGLWLEVEDGFQIRNYLDFNPDAETVKAERKNARERMRNLRKKKAEGEGSSPERDGERSPEHAPERDGERSHAVPSLTSPVPLKGTSKASPSPDIRRVYDYWREKRGKTRANYARMSDGRRKKIQARLREFSADELCRAIDGIALDPWDGRAMQDDLTIVFRSTEQVDKFLELAATGGNVQGAAAHNEFQAYMRQKLEVVNGG